MSINTNTNMEDSSVYMILHQLVHLSKYQALKRMDEFDLKPSQAGVLFILSCNGKLSQRELAEKIGITPPSMTVALRKMEDMGYIAKEPDEKDQRIIRVMLTEKGSSFVGKIKEVIEKMEILLYENISREEQLLFRRLLLQMRQNLLASKEFQGMDMEVIMRNTHPPMKDRL